MTEEVSGIDLVREMFRIADGRAARLRRPGRCAATRSSSGSTPRTPAATSCPRPARSPAGGRPPGPGVRVDEGYAAGMTVPGELRLAAGQADRHRRRPRRRRSSGPPRPGRARRRRACRRSCRSTGPCSTTRRSPPRRPFGVHTRWIETEFDGGSLPYAADRSAESAATPVEGRGSWSRSAASGSRSSCRPASARGTVVADGCARAPSGPPPRRRRSRRGQGAVRRRARPLRCRARSSRSPSPRATWSRRATWSSCWRR